MSGFITIPSNVTGFRLANARVPVCLADAPQLAPDADGLAPCDIVIDNGRIATIGPAVQDGLARFDLESGIVLPRLSTCTPISTRGTSGGARKIRTARISAPVWP